MFIKTVSGGDIVIDAITYVGEMRVTEEDAVYGIYYRPGIDTYVEMWFSEANDGEDYKEKAEESREDVLDKIKQWKLKSIKQ